MNASMKTIEFKFERTIPASPDEVFDGWLDPKIPGNPWNAAEKYLLNPKVDGLFYWALKGTSHYGRSHGDRAAGSNSAYLDVTQYPGAGVDGHADLQEQGEDTLMTLVHSGLPDHELARGHEKGWNYFLGVYLEQFGMAHTRNSAGKTPIIARRNKV